MLHIVNKPHLLISCLRLANSGDVILLIEDGVLAALKHSATETIITESLKKYSFFALQTDVAAHGISAHTMSDIPLIDYEGFVDLTLQHNPIQSWC